MFTRKATPEPDRAATLAEDNDKLMTPPRSRKRLIDRLTENETLNFIASNHIPRAWVTRLVGRISKSEHPWVRELSFALWKWFVDLDLSESKLQHFRSVHECFTRELRADARPIDRDPGVVVSPCDGIVGQCGPITGNILLQAKGLTYTLDELVRDGVLADVFRNGIYVTLRLTSAMYHRFHAPDDCFIDQVNYISGETFNVNPPALKRIAKLFCKNERAVIRATLSDGAPFAIVPIAAVLVASMRLHFANVLLHLKYQGPSVIPCDASLTRGQEMGWFEHGSTIIVLAPRGFGLVDGIRVGSRIKMGERLLLKPLRKLRTTNFSADQNQEQFIAQGFKPALSSPTLPVHRDCSVTARFE